VSELAFARRAAVAPHTNPNTTLFVVVSGGGWVQVGDERVRVNHGEAVVWPPQVAHGAFTDGSEMRAIVVELRCDPGDRAIEGVAEPISDLASAAPARGALAERPARPEEHDPSQGEPW
jgi:quercetin dioxygenase-like cupin family protein